MNGSGKTTLAKEFLQTVYNAIVVDTKCVENWTDVGYSITGDDIYDVGAGRYVWHVPDSFLLDFDEQDHFFRHVLKERNRVIYIDEVADVGPSANRFAAGLKLVAQRGRAAGVGLWVSTQRPYSVPLFTISEAQYRVTFEMALDDDRKRIEQVFERKLEWEQISGTHAFYVKRGRAFAGPLTLPNPNEKRKVA